MTGQSFVILTSQRTGSTLLVRSLDSHPEVCCPGETFYRGRNSDLTIFNYAKRRRTGTFDLWFRRGRLVHEYLDWFYSLQGYAAIGFKFMYGQARRLPPRFPQVVDYITANNVTVIHNIRENYLAVLLSRILAKGTGIYRAEQPVRTKAVEIPVRGLLHELERMRGTDRQWAGIMAGLPYHMVTYEALVASPEAETARLLAILGIDSDFTLQTGLTQGGTEAPGRRNHELCRAGTRPHRHPVRTLSRWQPGARPDRNRLQPAMANDRLRRLLRKSARRMNWWSVFCELDKAADPLCMVAGYTRSGTTLLGRMLANLFHCRPVHEPLNPKSSRYVSFFHERESLDLIRRSERHRQALRTVFSGQFRGTRMTNTGTGLIYHNRLVKIVRANHYLDYLLDVLPRTPFVFIMRNPVDCVQSRIRLGWDVPDFSHCFEEISKYLTSEQCRVYREASDRVEQLAVSWCLDNFMALRNLQNDRFLLTRYETLVSDTRNELQRIGRHVNGTIRDRELLREMHLEGLPRAGSVTVVPACLSPADQERVWYIVSRFGLEEFYTSQTGSPASMGQGR